MARLYISYSHHDREYVDTLVAALKDLGQELVYDESSLSVGQDWDSVLSAGLREAEAIVFVLSKNSIDSRYVLTEMGAALGYFKERGRPILLPIVIDDSELPPQMRHIMALFDRTHSPEEIAVKVALAVEQHAGRAQAQAEKQQEVRQRMTSSADDFIESSLRDLRQRELGYKRGAYIWYFVAFVVLVAGLLIALWRAWNITGHLSNWIDLASFAAVGVVVLGLLVAVARFAFMLGKSFMVEALRVSDRLHAISFGAFYLRAFPDKIEWEHVKDAFQNWNIDKGSYFLTQSTADFDNEVLKVAVAIAEALKSAKGK